jgi:hypothetical protein
LRSGGEGALELNKKKHHVKEKQVKKTVENCGT